METLLQDNLRVPVGWVGEPRSRTAPRAGKRPVFRGSLNHGDVGEAGEKRLREEGWLETGTGDLSPHFNHISERGGRSPERGRLVICGVGCSRPPGLGAAEGDSDLYSGLTGGVGRTVDRHHGRQIMLGRGGCRGHIDARETPECHLGPAGSSEPPGPA